jgi:hypothetical protein
MAPMLRMDEAPLPHMKQDQRVVGGTVAGLKETRDVLTGPEAYTINRKEHPGRGTLFVQHPGICTCWVQQVCRWRVRSTNIFIGTSVTTSRRLQLADQLEL